LFQSDGSASRNPRPEISGLDTELPKRARPGRRMWEPSANYWTRFNR